MRNRVEWFALADAVNIESGDILIKHVWNMADGGPRDRDTVELLVRAGNALQWFDTQGSRSAEHVALVGRVGGTAFIFEADEDGIRVRNAPGDTAVFLFSNFYTVYRMADGPFREGWRLLCDGMATRLAVVQSGTAQAPVPIPLVPALAQDLRIRVAVQQAHVLLQNQVQVTNYSIFNVLSSLLPNIIPDNYLSQNDEEMLRFISGDARRISYICSGFVASMLQLFVVNYHNNRRLYIDPAQVHPSGIEHTIRTGAVPNMDPLPRRIGGHCMPAHPPISLLLAHHLA